MRKLDFIGIVIIGSLPASGAILTAVPMGGSMVHANVLYVASGQRLEVHVEPTVPVLAPLDVTNPADSYAWDDPWFECLDPSQQGLAFNRQYGLVVDGGTDPIPATMGIWIRHVSCSSGLAFFRYRSGGGTKAWDPMFGTAGSTNVFEWNLSMFHPAIAITPTNGTCTARFEAFAVDLNTGQALAAIAPAQFDLNWTIAPSARPLLRFGADLVLEWPASATNYVLESANSLAGPWAATPGVPQIKDGKYTLSIDPVPASQVFRLRRLP